jgi:hypothetical protein
VINLLLNLKVEKVDHLYPQMLPQEELTYNRLGWS